MRAIKTDVSGGCQCGAVRYHLTEVFDTAHICHCRMCQKQVGNFFASLVGAPKRALSWTRGSPAAFRSSDLAERGFCRECGTPLFYNSLENDRINLTIGSLDAPQNFPPVRQYGMEARMPWLDDLASLPDDGVTGSGDEAEWAAAIRKTNRQHPDRDTNEWPPKTQPA